nr:hypothetical protein [Mucilaginibacter sp. FT3.2]
MTVDDFLILGKKVLIGLLIGIIPLALVTGGLWLITALLK